MPFTGGNETPVNQTLASTQTTSLTNSFQINERPMQSIGMDANGNTIVVWSSQGQDVPTENLLYGVYGRRYDVTTGTWGPEFLINQGLPASDPTSQLSGNQLGSSVAVNDDGSFIVTWTDGSLNQPAEDLGTYGVYARRYDSAGNAIGNQFLINQTITGDQSDSSIASNSTGDFVVTWTSRDQDGDGRGIFVRRFNKDGSPKTPANDIQVNTYTTGDQIHSTVAMDGSGNFVVVWESVSQDGSGSGIYGQRFNADGSKNGAEFRINTITANDQLFANVSMDATGNFVVTWTSNTGAVNGRDVYARRYSSTGAALDAAEFAVNTNRANTQQYSQVKLLKTGDFLITWTGTDADGTNVYGRRYNFTTGQPLPGADGNDFIVNTTTTGNQGLSAVAGDSKGNFAFAWTSNQGGSDDVYSRIYQFTPNPNNPPTDISFSKTTSVSSTATSENVAAGSVVGNLFTTDPDAADTAFTYQLVTGTGSDDNAAFQIVKNATTGNDELRIINSPDFETKSSYSVRVRTTDPGGLSFEKVLAVNVTDLNEAPTDIALSKQDIDENLGANATVGAFSTVDPDKVDTFTYTLVTGAEAVGTDNAAFSISGNTLKLIANADYETKKSYTVLVQVSDKGGLTFKKTFAISVNDKNEAPTGIAIDKNNINENVPANSVVGTFTTTDPDASDKDANNSFTYTLVPGAGSTDNASFTIVDRTLQINQSPDFETKPSYSVRVRSTDKGGLPTEQTFTININNLPETPTNVAPTDLAVTPGSVNENVGAGALVGTFSSTDANAGDTFTYALVSGTGSTDNAAFQIVQNPTTGKSELRIVNNPDYEQKNSYSIRVRTTDQSGLNFEKPLTITINDVNEAPTDILLNPNSIKEDAPIGTVIGDLSAIGDPDQNETFTYALVTGTGSTDNGAFTLTPAGKLALNTALDYETKTTYSIRVRVTDKGGTGLSIEKALQVLVTDVAEPGSPTNIGLSKADIDENLPVNSVVGTLSSTDLDSPNGPFTYTIVPNFGDAANFTISGNQLILKPSADFETKPQYTINIKTTDPTNLSFTKTFVINVNDKNEAPTDLKLSATTIVENKPANSLIGTLTSVDPDLADNQLGNQFTYTLVDGVGATDNSAFTITNGNELRLIAAPNFEAKPSYSIRLRTTDKGGLSFEKTFTINVQDVGETPTNINLSATAIDENKPANSVVGTFSTVDPDLPNDSFTYSLVAGTGGDDNASFQIVKNAAGGSELQIKTSPNFEVKPSYAIRVRTTDKDGLTFDKSFIITVNDLPETPTDIGLSKTAVDEDVPANTVVGTFNTVDSDLPNDNFTYSLAAGTGSTDNAAFQIVGNQLQIKNSPNFEVKPSYSIRVRTTDKTGLTFEKVFTITVNNLTEPPTDIGLSKTNVNENVPVDTIVGTLSTVDPDLPNDSFTYSLAAGTGGDDNASFQIVGNQLQIKTSPNFEAKPSYSIRVKTTDKSGQSFEKIFTITINDLKEAPTDIGLSKTNVNENVPANTVVGTLNTVDSDLPNDSFTYSLAAGTGSDDNASFQIVGNQLQIKNSPNFETKSSYAIRVRTTDKDGLFFEKALIITVNDLPETPGSNPPQDINLSNNQIDENRPPGSIVGLLSTVDPDINDKFTYDLVTGDGSTDNSAFTIVNNELRIRNSFDYETKSTYSIRVRTRDAGSLAFEKVFTINVKDLPELPGDTDPTDLLLSKNTIDESVPADSVVGTLSTVDPDHGDTFTYSLESGFGDNSAFRIVGNELRIVSSPDFETKPSYSVRIITTDFGGRKFAKNFTIGINNLNDPPVVTTSPGGLFYNEGAAAVTVDPGINLSDIDSPNLEGATIRFTSGFTPQDILAVSAADGITTNYDAATGVLTLTGSAALATYQNLLRSLTYRNDSQNPGTAIRTIAFTVRDAASTSNVATRTVQTIPVDSPPVVVTSNGNLAYTENAGETAIDTGIVVSDVDSLNLTGATIQLTNYNPQQDQLDVTAPIGISSNFDAASGTLTLSGTASVASYQAALRSVTYLNTSGNPSTTPRTARFVVRDGSLSSNVATRTIQITQINSPPTITTSAGNLTYIENSGKQLVDPQLAVVDSDSQNLTGATVRLQNYLSNQDRLNVTAQSGITSSFDTATGQLTLTGTASVAAYQSVLRSLTYTNTIDNPAVKTRIVEYTTKDDTGAVSAPASRSIQVIPVNDAPVVKPAVKQITYSKGQLLIDSKLSLKDVDSPNLTGATVRIGNYVESEDNLLFKDQNGITGTFDRATGVLQLTGSASIANYQAALRSVQFSNSRAIPTATPRTLTIQVTDGIAVSDAASGQIQVQFAPNGIVPAIDLNGTAAGIDYGSTFVVGGPAVSVVSSDARFTNQAYPVLTAAQVAISNPLSGAAEQLTANTTGTGIKAAYDAGNSVLNFTGRATLADYLKVLRSVQYQNNRTDLDSTTRVLLFRVSNGNSSSEPAQTRVQISQIKLANGTLGADGTLYTTPATDIINALDSDDTVASTLDNLQQDDSIQAGAGRDTFVLLDGTGAATIDLNNPVNQVGGILTGNTVINGFEVFRLAGFAGTATMIGNEQDNTLVGGTGNDWISGGAGNDVLGGNAGNDTLDGGAGDDQLEGGLGDDLYIVDSPNDLIIEGLDQGFDQVQSSVDYTLGNNLEALTLTGTAIVGVGNDLDNQITGNAQNNLLNGGEGNDRLIGLQGRDTLIGGSGKDRFVLTEARRSSRDTIRDFRSVDDTIEIVRNGFSDTLKLGKIRASMFCLGARAADRSDRFIYNRNSGALFFDPDGAGGAGQVQIARLTNKAALHRSDIVIVDA